MYKLRAAYKLHPMPAKCRRVEVDEDASRPKGSEAAVFIYFCFVSFRFLVVLFPRTDLNVPVWTIDLIGTNPSGYLSTL